MGAYPTTEDEVRDYAGKLLGFSDTDNFIARAGVGQVTTLRQLGYGWIMLASKTES